METLIRKGRMDPEGQDPSPEKGVSIPLRLWPL